MLHLYTLLMWLEQIWCFQRNPYSKKGGLPTETGSETRLDMEAQMHSKH